MIHQIKNPLSSIIAKRNFKYTKLFVFGMIVTIIFCNNADSEDYDNYVFNKLNGTWRAVYAESHLYYNHTIKAEIERVYKITFNRKGDKIEAHFNMNKKKYKVSGPEREDIDYYTETIASTMVVKVINPVCIELNGKASIDTDYTNPVKKDEKKEIDLIIILEIMGDKLTHKYNNGYITTAVNEEFNLTREKTD
jgi:hypothetical protein